MKEKFKVICHPNCSCKWIFIIMKSAKVKRWLIDGADIYLVLHWHKIYLNSLKNNSNLLMLLKEYKKDTSPGYTVQDL